MLAPGVPASVIIDPLAHAGLHVMAVTEGDDARWIGDADSGTNRPPIVGFVLVEVHSHYVKPPARDLVLVPDAILLQHRHSSLAAFRRRRYSVIILPTWRAIVFQACGNLGLLDVSVQNCGIADELHTLRVERLRQLQDQVSAGTLLARHISGVIAERLVRGA